MRRVVLITSILAGVAVAAVVVAVVASWRGGGAPQPPQSSSITSLGYLPNTTGVEVTALTRLSHELESHPTTRFFEIRWVDSWFFGWCEEDQWAIDYDRQNQELTWVQMHSGYLEDWKPVPEPLVRSLASVGFDNKKLIEAGAKTDLH
jgi:hypothetical protein